eukprot:341624-Pelagomonas_calceolata.AAC.4
MLLMLGSFAAAAAAAAAASQGLEGLGLIFAPWKVHTSPSAPNPQQSTLSLLYSEPTYWRMHATSTHACNINRA